MGRATPTPHRGRATTPPPKPGRPTRGTSSHRGGNTPPGCTRTAPAAPGPDPAAGQNVFSPDPTPAPPSDPPPPHPTAPSGPCGQHRPRTGATTPAHQRRAAPTDLAATLRPRARRTSYDTPHLALPTSAHQPSPAPAVPRLPPPGPPRRAAQHAPPHPAIPRPTPRPRESATVRPRATAPAVRPPGGLGFAGAVGVDSKQPDVAADGGRSARCAVRPRERGPPTDCAATRGQLCPLSHAQPITSPFPP